MTGAWVAAVAALWAMVLLIGFLALGTLRRITGVLERVEQMSARELPALGAEPMTIVPPFELENAARDAVSSNELLVESATILLFIEPDCVSCQRLLDDMHDVGERLDGVPLLVVMSRSLDGRQFELSPGLRVLYQENDAATRAFSNRATPQAYTVGSDRFVLDRRVPRSLADLREMAHFQRNGGGEVQERQASKT